jgi:hypothetical protein
MHGPMNVKLESQSPGGLFYRRYYFYPQYTCPFGILKRSLPSRVTKEIMKIRKQKSWILMKEATEFSGTL